MKRLIKKVNVSFPPIRNRRDGIPSRAQDDFFLQHTDRNSHLWVESGLFTEGFSHPLASASDPAAKPNKHLRATSAHYHHCKQFPFIYTQKMI
jgi:hypothetical protein